MRALVLSALLVFASPALADQPPLIVAVDSSRSLTPADIAVVHDALAVGLETIPSEIPIGLVVFDDTARRLIDQTTDHQAVLDALAAVVPQGKTTVLYDAIYLAAQSMENGGVVLVVTDGRDENSAVTADDVHALCERNDVRILTAGVGRTIDDRALRRLALLTRGAYLGPSAESLRQELGKAVGPVLDDLAVEPTPTPVPPTPVSEKSASTGRAAEGGVSLIPGVPTAWVLGAAGAALLVIIGLFWGLSRRNRTPGTCPRCGTALPDDGEGCPVCEIERIRATADNDGIAEVGSPDTPGLDVGAMAFETRPEGVDRTVALGDVAVLTIHEEGREPREYTLPRDRIFAVGRAPKVNTVQIRDQTVSAQHFKVVFKDGRYYVVDLWTTNGTSVNHECVRVRPLSSGDVIRAGMTEFVFSEKPILPKAAPDQGSKTAPPSKRN